MTSMTEKPVDPKTTSKMVSDAVDFDASALEFEELNKESKRKMAEFQRENTKKMEELGDRMKEMTKKMSQRRQEKSTNPELQAKMDALERLSSSMSGSSPDDIDGHLERLKKDIDTEDEDENDMISYDDFGEEGE